MSAWMIWTATTAAAAIAAAAAAAAVSKRHGQDGIKHKDQKKRGGGA